ncbi:hypothetical protein A8U91_04719 [Halomonas elongata]|uniref:Primase C-terminal 2 domain-containing protein n=1 Tax=Halomonas elongata TaxID=2746 RepID=A0A1B8P057_HALEL|nr:PriCT-2 domain-containing protein [Halomonas elongata]OBX35645.1 hypothetical protein A8U91_04719 [Halomonas elongata]
MSQHDPLTYDELRLALQYIPADDRETWVNVGNACKTEYGDDGFAAWDEWSQQAASYKAVDAKSVWRSLTPGMCAWVPSSSSRRPVVGSVSAAR